MLRPAADPAGVVSHVARLSRPCVVVHGGAGSYLKTTTAEERASRGLALLEAAGLGLAAYDGSAAGAGRRAVLAAVEHLEADPRFNAGFGSRLQQDGRCRLSAALMDGAALKLSAVYNARDIVHPSRLAAALQEKGDRNLDGDGAELLMRALALAREDVRSEASIRRWRELVAGGDTADAEGAVGDAGTRGVALQRAGALAMPDGLGDVDQLPDARQRHGTVGAVAVGADGRPFACTSTGGRGHEHPGRVSDSPTPAGTYATDRVAVSVTGFGEQILDLGVAVRLATRVTDGLDLAAALERTMAEVVAHGGLLGLIALTSDGVAGYAHTTEACGVAWRDAAGAQHVDRHGR